ncbi:Cystathionine gamma-lyase [Sarcoptes scabiei]|uniref:cystathionine gamma-lyase n=1 Tax=Sarcoptes scabiei TaxID=52283 RepID=A0A834R4D5_SARSC|nr:Cystathionine gamma-lyase [Sarcoptes scabiei]
MDEDFLDKNFETKSIHCGQNPEQWNSRAVIPPIILSTTFKQIDPDVQEKYVYGRSSNPTRDSLQSCIASLENAEHALVFASGLATQTSISFLMEAGDHAIVGEELYGGTNRFFRTCSSRFDISISYADFRSVYDVINKINHRTKLVWFETPTNPLLRVADIKAICTAIKSIRSEIIIVVDNTFMSPYFQKPLNLGADISVNSITKYMNGHSDVIMGCIATNNTELYQRLKYLQNALGTVPSPFDCFLVNRGLKTLAIRMEKHQQNALEIARFLESHKQVQKVIYPGLESHPSYHIAKKQTTGTSGIISFYIKGNIENARKFLSSLKVFTLAESLGAVESLIEIPSLMTHASIPKEIREELGIKDTLIRISVGIEDVNDLLHDLDHALNESVYIVPNGA